MIIASPTVFSFRLPVPPYAVSIFVDYIFMVRADCFILNNEFGILSLEGDI